MHFLGSTISISEIVFGLIAIILAASIGYGLHGKRLHEIKSEEARVYKDIHDADKERINQLNEQMKLLSESSSAHERRIRRMELNENKYKKQKEIYETHIDYLEKLLGMVSPPADRAARDRFEETLSEMREFKAKSRSDYDRWENDQENFMAYMDEFEYDRKFGVNTSEKEISREV